MPVPVDEHARGKSPTGDVPKREAASCEREQQMLKHCLHAEKIKHVKYHSCHIEFTFRHSQACKFIQQRSPLIRLIIARFHVLRIKRAASGDRVLAELNRP